MLALEQVEWDGSGVVGFEELGSLVKQLALPTYETVTLAYLLLAERGHLFEDRLLRLEPEVVAEREALVVVLDCFFNVFDQDCALGAAGAASLTADAGEVGVDPPGVAAGVSDDESAVAATAPDRALEVVVVSALLLACEVLGFEDALYLIEDLLADERRMLAFVADATVLDNADVVRIAEEIVEGRDRDLLARPLRRRPADEAKRSQLIKQGADRPLAG